MIGRLAVRSLVAHPVRSAVLAAGFGVGVAVMAILLGVADIVLEQSRAPALVGGGDVVIRLAPNVPGQLVLSGALQSDALRPRVRVASPSHTSAVYLLHNDRSTRVRARGGIPSLERELGDRETASVAAWRDSPADTTWTRNTPEKILRHLDRFSGIPDAPEWQASWAEWLYFNGRARDARFYLTFIVGPPIGEDRREASVRLQLDRGKGMEDYDEQQPITHGAALAAPDLTIGASSVRLEGTRYRIHLDLRGANGRRVTGDLTLEASPGRLFPRAEFTGARGWLTGYVVPVMSGTLSGTFDVNGERISVDGVGYHDHNWGFWKGMSWRWGQVQHEDLSVLYGRIFPPREAADPDRLPGFLGVVGPSGPLAYTTNVTIAETNDAQGQPRTITVTGRGNNLDLQLRFDVESMATRRGGGSVAQGATGLDTLGSRLDFFQLRGSYTVTGRAADRPVNFVAPGSAETFRGK
ncbi:MAG: hypothetical protein ACRD3C_08155 [Vicinamibacterales bacterium]